MDYNRLAWASRIADGLPAQAVSAHRTLSMFVGEAADNIDVEAEVCRLMGFDPATYALMEDLSEMTNDDEEDIDGRSGENPPT